jgi:hypothetical protein
VLGRSFCLKRIFTLLPVLNCSPLVPICLSRLHLHCANIIRKKEDSIIYILQSGIKSCDRFFSILFLCSSICSLITLAFCNDFLAAHSLFRIASPPHPGGCHPSQIYAINAAFDEVTEMALLIQRGVASIQAGKESPVVGWLSIHYLKSRLLRTCEIQELSDLWCRPTLCQRSIVSIFLDYALDSNPARPHDEDVSFRCWRICVARRSSSNVL